MIRLQKNPGSWLRACRALILATWLLPLSLAAASNVPTTQDLANSAREGDRLIEALEQEYVVKKKAIRDDSGFSPEERQQKIIAMDKELKRNRVQLWEKYIHPFQERVINEVNEGVPEADQLRATGGSQLYARDAEGKIMTQTHPDGKESKVYNRQFNARDLDVGTPSKKVADKFQKRMKDLGFDPENSNRYASDFMGGKFTMNVGPDHHETGSYLHRQAMGDMANTPETFLSISCQRLQATNECPGKKLVSVNDVNSKGLKYLHGAPGNLLGHENQDKLSNAVKSAFKAIDVGDVTPEQLEKIAKGKGFTPEQFRQILHDIKADGFSAEAAGLNKDNIAGFQEMARGVTDQAVENAKVDWEREKRGLQSARQTMEDEFNRAKQNGASEKDLEEIRKTMRDYDSALTDAQIRVDATTKINQRLKTDVKVPPSPTDQVLRKVKDSVKNAGGAVGTSVKNAGFEQATRTQGPSLADATKDAFRPGWLGAGFMALDVWNVYKCSEDKSSSARHVCYWKEGSGAVFGVMSDIGVAGSAGIGLGGALGTGTAAGLLTIGAPIIVSGVTGAQVSELVGEVKGSQAAELNEKFANSYSNERQLATIQKIDETARRALENFRSTGDWQYLKAATLLSSKLRSIGAATGDRDYFAQFADQLDQKANEYAQLVSTGTTSQDEYNFEDNQLGSKDETDLANLKKQVENQKAAQGRSVGADNAAGSLNFNEAASAVADHEAAWAQIEKNRRETAEIYARIAESEKRRAEEWKNFWQGVGVVAGAFTQATNDYLEQKRKIDEQLKKDEKAKESESTQNVTGPDFCATWKVSPDDYQRCQNDPCSVYVYNQYAFQQCQANLYASAGPSGDGVPTVKPEHMREGVCNTLYDHGSDEPEQYSIPVSPGSAGGYVYWYEHYGIKDQARIYLNGSLIRDTGCTGGSKDIPLPELSGGGQVRIIIDPKCNPSDSSGTKWQFKLSCP